MPALLDANGVRSEVSRKAVTYIPPKRAGEANKLRFIFCWPHRLWLVNVSARLLSRSLTERWADLEFVPPICNGLNHCYCDCRFDVSPPRLVLYRRWYAGSILAVTSHLTGKECYFQLAWYRWM